MRTPTPLPFAFVAAPTAGNEAAAVTAVRALGVERSRTP